MIWQCPNKCTEPIELPDGNSVTCGYCLTTTDGTGDNKPAYNSGIGKELKRRLKLAGKVIEWLKLPCNCDSMIAQLNSLTPEQCEESFDKLLEQIIASGQKAGLPVANSMARGWIAKQFRKAILQAAKQSQPE